MNIRNLPKYIQFHIHYLKESENIRLIADIQLRFYRKT